MLMMVITAQLPAWCLQAWPIFQRMFAVTALRCEASPSWLILTRWLTRKLRPGSWKEKEVWAGNYRESGHDIRERASSSEECTLHIECQMSIGECGEMQDGEYALCTECWHSHTGAKNNIFHILPLKASPDEEIWQAVIRIMSSGHQCSKQ